MTLCESHTRCEDHLNSTPIPLTSTSTTLTSTSTTLTSTASVDTAGHHRARLLKPSASSTASLLLRGVLGVPPVVVAPLHSSRPAHTRFWMVDHGTAIQRPSREQETEAISLAIQHYHDGVSRCCMPAKALIPPLPCAAHEVYPQCSNSRPYSQEAP